MFATSKKTLEKFLKPEKQYKTGLAPGTLTYVGTQKHLPEVVTLIIFSKNSFSRKELSLEELQHIEIGPYENAWLNIDGLHNPELIKAVGIKFNIDTLILEDVMNSNQRPRYELEDDFLFLTLKMIYNPQQLSQGKTEAKTSKNQKNIATDHTTFFVEHVSFILKPNLLISFQETREDLFNPVRQRVEGGVWQSKNRQADYLLYALLDVIVDHYYLIADQRADDIEHTEASILEISGNSKTIEALHWQKRQTITLKRAIMPFKETLRNLIKENTSLINDDIRQYFHDVQDHIFQVTETLETNRENLNGLIDLQLSLASHRMNEVMKVLTIFAAIFIPLTFIAGIYGMNFEVMPELKWVYGYPVVLGLMAAMGLGMLIYFGRKGWL